MLARHSLCDDDSMTFGPDTTTDDVLEGMDLSGRHVVVTGASTGLGEETSRALAAHGASITMAVRDLGRGQIAADRIRSTLPDALLEVRQVDLASLDSVRSFAAAFLAERDRIDVLINNAGVMACPQGTTVDGFELQFGTNHLGHFLLTNLLLPALTAAQPARVVTVSSAAHRFSDVVLGDIGFEQSPYEPWIAYGRSKTANALFAVELDRRYAPGVHAYSLHPGGIQTELARHLTEESLNTLIAATPPGEPMQWKSIPAGAATSVWAATAAELDGHGGAYLEDCNVAALSPSPTSRSGVKPYALDADRARALWHLSAELVGLPAD